MQKKIIALAIAGLSTAAFAQSNVTVYGIIDVAQVSFNGGQDGTKSYQAPSGLNTSRLGFKGTENLGGGMTANFTIETGIANDAPAATTLGDRMSTVGLAGGFGSIDLGRQYTPVFDIRAAGDVSVTTYGISDYAYNSLTTRASNSMKYVSPSFSGFTAKVLLATGEQMTQTATASAKTNNIRGFSAQYSMGPIFVGAATQTTQDMSATAALDDKKETAFSASYDFGVAKLFASSAKAKVSNGGQEDKSTQFSVAAPMGAGALIASFYKHNRPTTADFKSTGYSAGYAYNMSKRTAVYGVVAKRNNKAASNLGFGGLFAAAADKDPSSYAIGVRHSF